MTDLQMQLTRLLGKKELSFGCVFKQAYTECFETVISKVVGGNFHSVTEGGIIHFPHVSQITEIIGHPATLGDLHRMLASLGIHFRQSEKTIVLWNAEFEKVFDYDSSKDLLDQSESTLNEIISIINSHERN